MDEVLAYGWWLLEATVPPVAVMALLGFLFREKWKQILTRSLQVDLQRQRHEFARDLEAYKTSLIAQAEAVKLRSDVHKTLANKYMEKKFDALLVLEEKLAHAGGLVAASLAYPEAARDAGQVGEAIGAIGEFSKAWRAAEMFLDLPERKVVVGMLEKLSQMLDHIGPGKALLGPETPAGNELMQMRIAVERVVRDKLHALCSLPT